MKCMYESLLGRFISHDTWFGDAYMPMSYNMWLYGYGNPMRYSDPSGNFAILAAVLPGLVGGTVGFLSGAAIGGVVGACFYEMALTGQCGCAMKQEAFLTTRSDWVLKNMMGGALVGGLLGAVSAYGPAGLLIGSGIGLILSTSDLIATIKIVNNETGWTPCTIARAILDVTGIVLSIAGGVTALRNWKATGGKWTWKSISSDEPMVNGGNDENFAKVEIQYKEEMPLSQFNKKTNALQEVSDQGLPYKAENPVSRDPNITKAYKQQVIQKIWDQYGKSNPEFANQLIERVTTKMHADHIWDLQLGGPDTLSNLQLLDGFTNTDIGVSQIWPQIRNLPTGTPIKIIIRR